MTGRMFTDMLGNAMLLPQQPRRIVSLVPSQTELLYHFGLDDEVIGITKFCVHPREWFRNKKRIGGTKSVHIDVVRGLQPDLIIANKEENLQDQVETLREFCPVWVSDIQNIPDALKMMNEVGALVGQKNTANSLTKRIEFKLDALRQTQSTRRKVAYLIWRKPWMAAGGDTFISHMIEAMGWENVLVNRQRYPEVTIPEIDEAGADLILLSSEPYPFKEKHAAEIAAMLPRTEVLLVDGEMFSWYGSRMELAIPYMQELRAANDVKKQ